MRYKVSTLFLLIACQLASANNDNFSFALEAGLVNDSQLAVEEIDQFESTSDTAKHFQFEADGNWKPADKLNVKAGYSYMDQSYQDNDEFDLTISRLHGDVSYDFPWLTLGVNQHKIDAKLAGDGFLDMTRKGYYIGKLFANSFYLRAESLEIDKTFDTLGDRNAETSALAVDGYYFFNDGLSFFSVGYETEDEKANAPEFSYDGTNYRATFSNKFSFLDKNSQMKLFWRYSDRDYKDIYPGIDQSRADTKSIYGLNWTLWFNDTLSLITEVEQTDSESNLESADYDATQVSLILRAEF